ncbi:dihydrolipoamide acetyltransferase family protein [Paenibacillus flagellatus]|uniref:Dihydrolipoamide acetyltransferase component of pyruvate dehydrogenase complex n=1 Tax=Paenibacillus flagellatus TaxID=2211139 RepID=A0A2V5K6M5_9BACL|nr:dihydrolipoamide acetyltransferase family protein [Paenibacillus flagellatus]PYI55031.1 branched-chain alpha-keto acid dehydrogenase subunit E2 [Paenibacillus flagellatus]
MKETKAQGTEIVIPQLAESLVSATIAKWLKKPGDYVEQYEPICELITEKVNAELPSTVEGTLLRLLVDEGETVAVGTAVALIAEAGSGSEAAEPAAESVSPPGAAVRPAAGADDTSMRGRYSPAVQQLAAEHGVPLQSLTGTGMGGRITRKDVLRYLEEGPSPAARPGAAESAPIAAEAPKLPVRSTGLHLSEEPPTPKIEVESRIDDGRGEYIIDVTPIRNTIATRMRQSVAEIPHAWTMIEVDVTNLVVLRNKIKDEFMKKEGINLTYLAFVLKAVVNAIKDYPIMNSVWAVDKIIVKRDINISLSVGTEDSVITPVIKKADQKNIAGLAREIDELSRKARSGKLRLDDVQGGTITVNNTGSFGSILSYPIINYPQAVNLTFESIVKRPVVIHDMIAVRSMANICLSLDHRILDGVICGRFLQRVKENLESYSLDTKLY